MDNKSTSVNRDMRLLSPFFADRVAKAVAHCYQLGYPVEVFEGYRSPERQDWLYAQGRTRDGKVVTKARAWESWHQFGLACDIALLINGKWSWDFDAAKVSQCFIDQGLEWLSPFEMCHFQASGGVPVKTARDLVMRQGLQTLWLEVEAKIK